MVTYDKQDKNLVIPTALGNFSKAGGGSGSGMTPEEVQGMIDTSIEEYDTEIQVDLEDIRDNVSGNTEDIATISGTTGALGEMVASLSAKTKETFYFDVASYFDMGYDDRRDYFDLVYAKVEQGAEIFALGVAEGDNQTVRIPLIKYKAETDPSTHTGGWLYFSAKAPQYNNNTNLYFSFSTSSVGNISGLNSSGLFASQTIYTLPSSVTDGIEALSGATSALTEGLDNVYGQTTANTQDIESVSGAVETLSQSLSGYTTTDTFNEGISGLTGQISGVSEDVEELSGKTAEVYDAIFYEDEGETYSQIDDLWDALGDKQDTLEFASGVTNNEGTVRVVPGHALKIGESGRVEINFGKGVQYGGDNELELNIGEGLGFSGDTLVVSGGSSNSQAFYIDDIYGTYSDLADLLFSYWDSTNGVMSSAYTAADIHIYMWMGQDFQGAFASEFKGYIEVFPDSVYEEDGVYTMNLTAVLSHSTTAYAFKYGLCEDGSSKGNWLEPVFNFSFSQYISYVRFGNNDRGYLTYDADNDRFEYDSGYVATGDTSNACEDLVDWLLTKQGIVDGELVFDYICVQNLNKFFVTSNGETRTYTHPTIGFRELSSPYTIGDYEFGYEITYVYTDWVLKIDMSEGHNVGANVRISAV